MIAYWLTLASCLVILVGSAVLWVSRRYDEGVIGHLALVLMMFACLMVLEESWTGGAEYEFLPETILLRLGVALLLIHLCVRHVCWRVWGRRGDTRTEGTLGKVCRHF
jgi:hypothetical protein